MKKILDQSTPQERLCENLVLVSADELQKVVAKITRDKVNTNEPPSIPIVTQVQPLIKTSVDTSDASVKVDLVEQRQITINQLDAQTQGTSQIIVLDKRISKESEDTLKEKEHEVIQALVTLPTSVTPTKVL